MVPTLARHSKPSRAGSLHDLVNQRMTKEIPLKLQEREQKAGHTDELAIQIADARIGTLNLDPTVRGKKSPK